MSALPGDGLELPILRPRLRDRLGEAIRSRHIVGAAIGSAVPVYRGGIFGRWLIVVIPLMQILGFAVLFGGVFHAKASNGVPYIIYLIFGMQAFQMLRMTLMFSTVSTKMLKSQTRGLRFPLLLIPFTALARAGVWLAIYWAIAVGVLLYYVAARGTLYLQLNLRFLAGIAGIVLVMLLAVSVGLTTSVIYPRARDVKYIVRYGLRFWMYLTPVVYSLHALPPFWQRLAQVNPLTPLIGLVQWGFVDAGWVRPWGLAWSLAAILLFGTFGVWFFNRHANAWVGVYQLQAEEETDDEDIF